MSIQNIGTTGVVLPPSAETPLQKFGRKFKQEPLVPIGAGLTTVALIMASIKLSRGDSKSLNHWLRARLIFQGLTIAAVVGGTYMYGQTKQQKEEQERRDTMEAEYEKVKERRAFEERLKAAEEAHAAETQMFAPTSTEKKQVAGAWSWFGLGKSHTVTSRDAMGVPSPSHPAAPVSQVPTTPVSESSQKSSSSGFWGRLGWK